MQTAKFALLIIACHASAAFAEMPDSELTKYQATINCIDKAYYSSGYSEKQSAHREALINLALKLESLPSYNTALEHKKLGKLDTKAYLEARDNCKARWNTINTKAASLGVKPTYQ